VAMPIKSIRSVLACTLSRLKSATPSCCGSKIISGLDYRRDYSIKPYGFGFVSYTNLKMKSQLFQDGIILSKTVI
ncbi:hypothetical protein ACFL2E_03895, partial [Thermodesulfobacteriota bacterium]